MNSNALGARQLSKLSPKWSEVYILTPIFSSSARREIDIMVQRIIIFCMSILILGCASGVYIERNVDLSVPDSFSRVTGDSEKEHDFLVGLDERIVFVNVDGKNLWNMAYTLSFPEEVIVTPGHHRISAKYMYLGSYAIGCIEFEAEANTNYVVKKLAEGYGVSFWLEDSSGNVVGNICGFRSDKKE